MLQKFFPFRKWTVVFSLEQRFPGFPFRRMFAGSLRDSTLKRRSTKKKGGRLYCVLIGMTETSMAAMVKEAVNVGYGCKLRILVSPGLSRTPCNRVFMGLRNHPRKLSTSIKEWNDYTVDGFLIRAISHCSHLLTFTFHCNLW